MFEGDLELIRGPLTQQEFLILLYEGSTKAEACAQLRLNPAAVAFARREQSKFDAAIRDAEAFRIDMMTDNLLNIQDSESDPLMCRVMSDNIKWLASKRLREIYGDKIDHHVEHTLSIKDAIEQAKNRTIEFIDAKVLECEDSSSDNISVAQEKEVVIIEEDDPLS